MCYNSVEGVESFMGAIFMILLAMAIISAMTGIPFGVIFIIGIVLIVIWFVYESSKSSAEKAELEETKENIKEDFDKYMNKYKRLLTKYKKSGYYLKSANKYGYDTKHYAIFDNNIHILDDIDDEEDWFDYIASTYGEEVPEKIEELIYSVDDIRYYKLEGSVYQQQRISGGGGGGSSIKGAVVGGLVAGNAGAIIGSRKKIDDVQTTYVEEDDRRVVVMFVDDDELDLPYQFYDRLLDYAPEKDYDNYIAAKKAKGRKK